MRAKFLSLVLITFGWATLCQRFVTAAVQESREAVASNVPTVAKKPQGFVPHGWQIDSLAEGNLDKDDRKDCALIVSDKDGQHRRLVVALASADGHLHKVQDVEKAVALACGPSGGIPEVEIHNRVLVVQHYCGARERYETQHKYQFRNGKWFLIGYTATTNDANAPDHDQSVDVNLLIGDVAGTYEAGAKKKSARFLEVRSPLVSGKEPELTDWISPAAWLNKKSVECPIVAVQSVHTNAKLFLRVQLQDSTKLDENEIKLLDEKRQPVSAVGMKKTAYGYVIATYDMTAPPLSTALAEARKEDDYNLPLLRFSVQVTPKSAGCNKTFSTANRGAGGVLLTKQMNIPTLEDVDVRDGAFVHPFLWVLPSE